ncbi:hypothetical protein KEM48_002735 [Puccinia striiformis f. sp. tritici PST-130]|nr:hypothetical protein KEM48_002735 [Puccinia striiformis f. sp. tritici PST-130]
MKKSSIHWIMLVTLATGCNARLDPVHPDDWDLIQIDWLYEPEYPQTLNAQHPSTHRNQAPPPSNTSPSHWPNLADECGRTRYRSPNDPKTMH